MRFNFVENKLVDGPPPLPSWLVLTMDKALEALRRSLSLPVRSSQYSSQYARRAIIRNNLLVCYAQRILVFNLNGI